MILPMFLRPVRTRTMLIDYALFYVETRMASALRLLTASAPTRTNGITQAATNVQTVPMRSQGSHHTVKQKKNSKNIKDQSTYNYNGECRHHRQQAMGRLRFPYRLSSSEPSSSLHEHDGPQLHLHLRLRGPCLGAPPGKTVWLELRPDNPIAPPSPLHRWPDMAPLQLQPQVWSRPPARSKVDDRSATATSPSFDNGLSAARGSPDRFTEACARRAEHILPIVTKSLPVRDTPTNLRVVTPHHYDTNWNATSQLFVEGRSRSATNSPHAGN